MCLCEGEITGWTINTGSLITTRCCSSHFLPEQTEDGTTGDESDQRQTVTQSVKSLHQHIEDQLWSTKDYYYDYY